VVKLYMQLLDVLVFNFAGLFTDYKILVSVQLFNLNLKGSHFFKFRRTIKYCAVSPTEPNAKDMISEGLHGSRLRSFPVPNK
jgi:hypothetical protein